MNVAIGKLGVEDDGRLHTHGPRHGREEFMSWERYGRDMTQ